MTEQQFEGAARIAAPPGEPAYAPAMSEKAYDDNWGAWYRTVDGRYQFHEGTASLPPDDDSVGWMEQDPFVAHRKRAAAIRERMAKQTHRPDTAPDPNDDYSLQPMDAQFVGENTRVNAAGEATVYQVKYHTSETAVFRAVQQEQYTEPDPYDDTRQIVRARMESDGAVVPDGSYGWVLDSTENLFLFDASVGFAYLYDEDDRPLGKRELLTGDDLVALYEQGYQIQRHSTQAGGQPVIGAGMLTVADGRIDLLTDQSGHYKPFMANISNAAAVLVAKGFMDKSTPVQITGSFNDEHGRPIGKQFVAKMWDQNHRINPDNMLVPEQILELDRDEVHVRQQLALNQEIVAAGGSPQAAAQQGAPALDPDGAAGAQTTSSRYAVGSDQPPQWSDDEDDGALAGHQTTGIQTISSGYAVSSDQPPQWSDDEVAALAAEQADLLASTQFSDDDDPTGQLDQWPEDDDEEQADLEFSNDDEDALDG